MPSQPDSQNESYHTSNASPSPQHTVIEETVIEPTAEESQELGNGFLALSGKANEPEDDLDHDTTLNTTISTFAASVTEPQIDDTMDTEIEDSVPLEDAVPKKKIVVPVNEIPASDDGTDEDDDSDLDVPAADTHQEASPTVQKTGSPKRARASDDTDDEDASSPLKRPCRSKPKAQPSTKKDSPKTIKKSKQATEDGSKTTTSHVTLADVQLTRQPDPTSSEQLTAKDLSLETARRSMKKKAQMFRRNSTQDDDPPSSSSARQLKAKPKRRSSPVVEVHQTKALKRTNILLTSTKLQSDKELPRWLKTNNARIVTAVPGEAAFICVVGRSSKVPTTAKLLKALILDQPVVTDLWLEDSVEADSLLPTTEYEHPSIAGTKERDRKILFAGKDVFVTPAAKAQYGDGWKDIVALLKVAGAKKVDFGDPDNVPEEKKAITIFIGATTYDAHAAWLMENDIVVYAKDILSQSILNGELDLTSAKFRLKKGAAPQQGKGRR